ncbi:S8 family peptidase [Parasphingorhabdus sp.]|uniref:S8 family peptidase n=1 Tax=Parasphingorhabdus sp. TaxID=2709688 RepID=UPI0030AB60CE
MIANCSDGNHRRKVLSRSGMICAVVLVLQGCGGGGTVSTPRPAPAPTPTPTPAPTPTPTPTPAAVFDTSEYRRSTGPSQQNTIPAWQLGASGAGVTLAIIDSGIDTSNPEFAGRISSASADVAGSRGLNNVDSSHGTQVALTAAAARDGLGMLGVAWGVTIQALRADSPGSCATPLVGDSGGCGFSDTAITAGVDRAIAGGAKVINISLGGSPPNGALNAAIGRAAAAGIVVVVSAGNDGVTSTDNPDVFAVGLRLAGNGNVIIAGSVDSSNAISSFSNLAGTEAAWYLMALGEQVCCVYENGQIKITTDASGQQFVTVVSGTSFSAPQIAGAAALLRQYFPNLAAAQTVDLLLRTASDLGAAGSDTVYGRGLMNIGAAFAPQGVTSLADNRTALIPLGDSAVVTSAAMGDTGQGAQLNAIVLDSYGRAYSVDLGASLRTTRVTPRLGGALLGQGRSVNASLGEASLAFSLAAPQIGGREPSGLIRLSLRDAEVARALAAKVVTRLSPRASFGFAYAMSAYGVVAQLQGQTRPAFLVASDPGGDFGFSRTGLTALALRRSFGPWGATFAAENGKVLSGSPYAFGQSLSEARRQDRFVRMGLSFDRRFGAFETSLGASWLSENRSVLGAHLHQVFGARGADSMFIDLNGAWHPGANWRLGAAWRQGWTKARIGGRVSPGSLLTSNGWAVDASRYAVFQSDDSLSLRLSQPLRVSSGGINLLLPIAYSYETLSATNALRRINLAPSGREISRELAWRGSFAGGSLNASAFWRSQPGNYADLPDDYGLGLMWEVEF